MKFSFKVGEKEKHDVAFRWNQMLGSLRILVDESIIERRFLQLVSPNKTAQRNSESKEDTWVIFGKEIDLIDRWEFTVGETEQHTIRIEKKRPKWNAGFRPHKYRVFVDGAEIINRTGY